MTMTAFDWSDLAFGSKKPINSLQATFIAAPREMSVARFTELVKAYLPIGNIVLGISKDDYVEKLDDQPQFRMLALATVQPVIDKIAASASKHKVYSLEYFQRETPYILEKLDAARGVFVNGSWHHSFHLQPAYFILAKRRINYELVSPFCNETEAKAYEQTTTPKIIKRQPSNKAPIHTETYTGKEMLAIAQTTAKLSYDHTNQTGVALGKPAGKGYQLLLRAYNKVVPYQTYAMHFGSLREQHFSPPNDLNHYDTIHAEVALLIAAQEQGLDLHGTTLFINVLPCPTCGRMIAETAIAEVVYHLDHSNGYTLGMFEKSAKKVRRIAL